MSETGSTIGSGLFDISEDLLDDIEGFCLESMMMSRDNLSARWRERLDSSHAEASERFACKGMLEGFPIDRIDGREVHLQGGAVLESAVLAEALADAKEVAVFAVAVHGFEELCESEDASGTDLMLYTGWGSGFSRSSRKWIEDEVGRRAHAQGMHAGKTWFPGEEGLELSLQASVARLIDVAEIGLEIDEDFIMRPTMSVTGFIPILT